MELNFRVIFFLLSLLSKISLASKIPIGINNTDGSCYINSTLQALFNLDTLNKKIQKADITDKQIILTHYLRNLQFYKKYQLTDKKNITLEKSIFLSEDHEPSKIIQDFFIEIDEIQYKGENFAKLFITHIKDFYSINHHANKNIIQTETQKTKTIIVIINNPYYLKLSSLINYNLKNIPDLSILHLRKNNTVYKLSSIICACHLFQINNFDNYDDSINHSISYINKEGRWFFVSDDLLVEKSTTDMSQFLTGRKDSEHVKNLKFNNIVPGILFFEKIED